MELSEQGGEYGAMSSSPAMNDQHSITFVCDYRF